MKQFVCIAVAGALLSAAIVLARLGRPTPAKAQAACSASSLQGTYAFHLQGWILDDQSHAQTPLAEAGLAVADGSGNMKVAGTVNVAGQTQKLAFDFTYQVNADCSGSMTPSPGSQAGPSDIFLADGGKQMMLVVTQAGIVLSGTAVRQ